MADYVLNWWVRWTKKLIQTAIVGCFAQQKQALERSVFMFAYDCLRLFLKLNEWG